MLQIISSVYDLDNISTWDKKMPESSTSYPFVLLKLTLIGFQRVHFPSDVRHYSQKELSWHWEAKGLMKLENLTLD